MRAFILVFVVACMVFSVSADYIYVPAEYLTIQEGIDASSDGDVVFVDDGIYVGYNNKNIDFHGKIIELRSENGSANCVIDCEDSGQGFYFHSGETVATILSGFTIQNGFAYQNYPRNRGGAICCINSSPTIIDCVMKDNRALFEGGGIFCKESSAIISGCIIENNQIPVQDNYYGGGMCCDECSGLQLVDCQISHNEAMRGGGLYCRNDGDITLSNCVFSDNSALLYGGGICSFGPVVGLEDCSFFGNSAERGGGVYVYYWQVTADNCAFAYNNAVYGGAMYVGRAVIKNSVIAYNNSSSNGGGIYFDNTEVSVMLDGSVFFQNTAGHDGGGIFTKLVDGSDITRCVFSENVAQNRGGGICGDDSYQITISNTLLSCNVAYFGGAICDAPGVNLLNCTSTGNTASFGGCMGVSSLYVPVITNCILWGDIAYMSGDEFYFLDTQVEPIVSYSNVNGGWPGIGNIDADPLFTTGFLGDYYLSQQVCGDPYDSPCLNSGSNYATNICYPTTSGQICLSELTTRTDIVVDSGVVDIGYHYMPTSNTPVPIPTVTPNATQTIIPSETPTASPTEVPTTTPSATPTNENTITPTPTTEIPHVVPSTSSSGIQLLLLSFSLLILGKRYM